MRIIRSMLLSGAAIAALAGVAVADGTAPPDAINLEALAATAAPRLPDGSKLMSISRTAQPEVPGLPLSARDKAALGDTATTLRILPADGTGANGSISWSGYTRAGVVYQGTN